MACKMQSATVLLLLFNLLTYPAAAGVPSVSSLTTKSPPVPDGSNKVGSTKAAVVLNLGTTSNSSRGLWDDIKNKVGKVAEDGYNAVGAGLKKVGQVAEDGFNEFKKGINRPASEVGPRYGCTDGNCWVGCSGEKLFNKHYWCWTGKTCQDKSGCSNRDSCHSNCELDYERRKSNDFDAPLGKKKNAAGATGDTDGGSDTNNGDSDGSLGNNNQGNGDSDQSRKWGFQYSGNNNQGTGGSEGSSGNDGQDNSGSNGNSGNNDGGNGDTGGGSGNDETKKKR